MADLTKVIHFPNGKGETPVSAEYYAAYDEQRALCDLQFGENTDDLSPADYNHWHTLQHRLDTMLISGEHVGKPVIYG